jgi:hypothetical protein
MSREGWPKMGDQVEDIVSGYSGVVTAFVEYLWGCEQVLVGRADKDGKPESEWFDVGRTRIVTRAALSPVQYGEGAKSAGKPTGADKPAPIR